MSGKTKEEMQKIGENTRFQAGSKQAEIARRAGIKSGESRRKMRIIKEEILNRMKEEDWNEMIMNVIERAKSNDEGFKTLRDTIGQAPQKEVNVNVETPVFIDDLNE